MKNKQDSLGQRIKGLRKGKGMTQEDLGDVVDRNPSTISLWEGNRNKPRPDELIILANFFHKNVAWLMTGKEEEELGDNVREGVVQYQAEPEIDRRLLEEIIKEVFAQGAGQPIERLSEVTAETYSMARKKGKSLCIADAVRMWIS